VTDLTLDYRTFEYNDGTWTRLRFEYGSPWSNGGDGKPDVTVWIDRYELGSNGFNLEGRPHSSMCFVLNEVNVALLAGYLGAVSKLMWHQWAEERQRKLRTDAVPP
jgi:hypothetical protein